MRTGGVDAPGVYRSIFRVVEFRALFAAHTISIVGDQFARVGLAVLVFNRTHSPGWTAFTYMLTFLPDLVGGPLLSGLADRYPRKAVMIGADVLRTGLVALMAIPAMPLPVVIALLVVVQLADSPGGAARGSLLPQVLEGDAYPAGQATMQVVMYVGQVIGFAAGGALITWIGTSGVLWADAATFAISALVVSRWVVARPAAADGESSGRSWWRDLVAGAGLVWSTRRLRALVALACVSGFYISGEALAAPYAAELGGGAVVVGLLFAAYAAGTAVGSLVVARLPATVRLRVMPPLVVAACVPLVVCWVNPDLAVVVVLFSMAGGASSYHVVASTTFVLEVPDERRGQAFGLARTALKVSQALGVGLSGLAAEHAAPHSVVAVSGALGVLAALGVVMMWRDAQAKSTVMATPYEERASLASDAVTRLVGEPAEDRPRSGS